MAHIVGALAASHAPQLLMRPGRWSELPTRTKQRFHPKPGIAAELAEEAKRGKHERCHRAFAALGAALAAWRPDAVIIIGDDQHENILDDNMPPFVIYAGAEADATMHFNYLGEASRDQMTRYPVAAPMAAGLLEGLMEEGFDPAWSTKLRDPTGLGHAFGRVLKFVMPEQLCPIVPVMVNTYYPPAPSARRCLEFGRALERVIGGLAGDARIALLASGGLSHTVIDEPLDAAVLAALETNDMDYLGAIPSSVLIEGTSEIRNWIIVAGAMNRGARIVDYVPCYRTAEGVGCAMGFALWN
ncbi:MAG TPA: hypothetical protein VN823_24045 [Stellaceae bacterium]|nr:hypothetical protein [Stellaceae bacterium]